MTNNPFSLGTMPTGIQLDAPQGGTVSVGHEPEVDQQVRNVIIIGSGPAGYTAAIYAARDGLEPLVLEGSIDVGGALMTTTDVENYPGFPEGVQGPELMTNMREQAARFGAELITDDAVWVDLTGDIKQVEDSEGNIYQARAVILAMGSGYRKLGLPEEEVYSGKGVSWCATCDGFFYKGRNIAVVGGGDSAAEEATFLTRFADKVTLIHRRDELRASRIMADRVLANPKITPLWNHVVTGMTGGGTLDALAVQNTQTGETSELEVDGLFVAIGHDPRSQLVAGQVDVDSAGYVLVDGSSTRTSLPGVFACGDLVDNVYRQAVTAAGTGCRAALDAEKYLEALADAPARAEALV
ncbi:MAG: thioredoxin-disulfide reductase [Brooklawnia sp.]|jgi:thioredoxin reductase (NADPH)